MLAFTKEIYKYYRKFPTKRTLREFVKESGLHSQVGQELVDRLIDALHKKIGMKKKGIIGGFPRFKTIDNMKSIVYPQSGFKLLDNRKLLVTPFGQINIKKHREIFGKIKTLTIKRESSDKYFAIFSAEEPKGIHSPNSGAQVGIDLGLKTFASLSNGTLIKNPRHLLKYEDKLKDQQQDLSRKKKGSKNRRKAKRKLAFIHEKLRNTRKDFLHKLSHNLVHSYSFIAVEDLSSQEMSEKNYGKQINDAGWSTFISCLCYKAESAGCRVKLVKAENTTKACSRCGFLSKKHLWDRSHDCPKCSLKMDRDLNAAINILNRATAGIAGSNACEDVAVATSVKQEAHDFSHG
jgi:putative transposase